MVEIAQTANTTTPWPDEDGVVHLVDTARGWLIVECTAESLMQLERFNLDEKLTVTCLYCLSGEFIGHEIEDE